MTVSEFIDYIKRYEDADVMYSYQSRYYVQSIPKMIEILSHFDPDSEIKTQHSLISAKNISVEHWVEEKDGGYIKTDRKVLVIE